MIGCAEFILVYDWTFEYLRTTYGETTVHRYWEECISHDSQGHARALIVPNGIEGMRQYWGHTLAQEDAGYTSCSNEKILRMDMYECPSQGILRERNQANYHDYCDHCMGWIKPMMDDAGFVIHHEHNHNCMCWWEFVRPEDDRGPSQPGELAGDDDVRLREDWLTDDIDGWRASIPMSSKPKE